jgi:hypothetical protein
MDRMKSQNSADRVGPKLFVSLDKYGGECKFTLEFVWRWVREFRNYIRLVVVHNVLTHIRSCHHRRGDRLLVDHARDEAGLPAVFCATRLGGQGSWVMHIPDQTAWL